MKFHFHLLSQTRLHSIHTHDTWHTLRCLMMMDMTVTKAIDLCKFPSRRIFIKFLKLQNLHIEYSSPSFQLIHVDTHWMQQCCEKKNMLGKPTSTRKIKLLEFMFSWISNVVCSDFHISRRYQPLLAMLNRMRLNIETTFVEFQTTQFVGTRQKAECVECELEFRWDSNDDWTHRLDLSIQFHLHFDNHTTLWEWKGVEKSLWN